MNVWLNGRIVPSSDARVSVFDRGVLFGDGVYELVRFFGGSWGRALQLAVLFGALLVLAVLLMSQTARAKVRVFINKNFFGAGADALQEFRCH